MKTRPIAFLFGALSAFAVGALLPPSASTQPPGQQPEGAYMVIGYMKVAPGRGPDYVALERDVWMPVHKERLRTGKMRSWALYGLRFPAGTEVPYNFAVVTTYDKWQDLDDFGYPALFQKVHPSLTLPEVGRRTNEARDQVRAEVWNLIEQIK